MGHALKQTESIATMKILVVDDQPEVLELIKTLLEPLGCEVSTLTDSLEAAERVQSESFDSVFVDVQMPEMDGYALATFVRSSLKNNKVPIVMLTDQDNIQTMRQAFKAGATCFLGKPISKDRIQSLYNVVLGPMLAQRRKQARVPFQTQVNCSFGARGGKQFATWSQNIGESGMTLELSENVEPGQSLNLEFSLFRGSPALQLIAKVVRLAPPNCLEVEFIHPSILDQERIQNFILNLPASSQSDVAMRPAARRANEPSREEESLQEIFEAIKRGPKIPSGPPQKRLKQAAYIAGMLVVSYLSYSLVTHLTASASGGGAAAPRDGRAVRGAQTAASGQPSPASAVPVKAPSLGVNPAVILAQYNPGQNISNDLVVSNSSGQLLNFAVTAEDMVIQQGRLVAVPAGQAPNGIAANVNFSNRVLSIPPWRTATLNVSMTIPFDTPVRAVLIVLNGTEKIPTASGITLQPSLGTLITFVDASTPGQKGTPPRVVQPGSLMNYPVSQWHAN